MATASQHAMYVIDCPRCGHLKTTFDVLASSYVFKRDYREHYECFFRCRSCFRASIALLKAREANLDVPVKLSGSYISNHYSFVEWIFEVPGSRPVPDHVPENMAGIFREGANCVAIGAWDAAGAMFRKVLDVSTRGIAPAPDSQVELRTPSWKVYKDLRLRLDWLFDNRLLSDSLKDLSSCIHQDGNDAAHDDMGIGKEEAEDLSDFADQILRVIFTIPGQILENKSRRDRRRGASEVPS